MFQPTYPAMRERAEAVAESIYQRARAACEASGLDPDYLGIHPHNAMVSYNAGQPWQGIDYSKVRLCQRLIERSWEPMRIVRRWYAKQPPSRTLDLFPNLRHASVPPPADPAPHDPARLDPNGTAEPRTRLVATVRGSGSICFGPGSLAEDIAIEDTATGVRRSLRPTPTNPSSEVVR